MIDEVLVQDLAVKVDILKAALLLGIKADCCCVKLLVAHLLLPS